MCMFVALSKLAKAMNDGETSVCFHQSWFEMAAFVKFEDENPDYEFCVQPDNVFVCITLSYKTPEFNPYLCMLMEMKHRKEIGRGRAVPSSATRFLIEDAVKQFNAMNSEYEAGFTMPYYYSNMDMHKCGVKMTMHVTEKGRALESYNTALMALTESYTTAA